MSSFTIINTIHTTRVSFHRLIHKDDYHNIYYFNFELFLNFVFAPHKECLVLMCREKTCITHSVFRMRNTNFY